MKLVDAKKYKKQIKKLYTTAFPLEERAPLVYLFLKTKNDNNKFYAVVDNDEFVGLVYIMQNDKMVYVFFLAIEEDKRGKGYGSKVLEIIKDMYKYRIVTLAIEDTADTEASNYEQRINRLAFYKKNGFMQLGIRVKELSVVYELLGTKEGVTQNDYLMLMKGFLGGLVYKIIYSNMDTK